MFTAGELVERQLDGLRTAFGPLVMAALGDPSVIEVRLNCDGRLWVDALGKPKHQVGEITPDDAMAALRQVSSLLGCELSAQQPEVAGELPFAGERFEGISPPIVERPIFAIRKKALQVFTLSHYVRNGILSFTQAEVLRSAIHATKNILVVGATKSGKTTFCNALLHEISELRPDCRMLLLEDTRELQCSLVDKCYLRASQWTTMAEISQWILRLSPESITVGEVRAGPATLSLLKNWNTGHPGGLATIHANSAYDGLTRVDQLIQEISANPMRELIADAINIVVFIGLERGVRKIQEILSVTGYDPTAGRFITKPVI